MQAPRLHPDTVEEVKRRADVVDIVSERVVLRKRGKDYQGLCPFHEEKTPSFTVSPSKQLYYCFGCGAGGGALKFLMEWEQQSFGEAVLALAQRYQVPVKSLEPEQQQQLQRQLSHRERLYEVVALAASFYQHALHQPQGEAALAYLRSQRQLSDATIEAFQLGYAPAGWETLYRYLVQQKGYPLALVEEAGLIQQRKSGSGYYDRFRDRLIIPIRDVQGRPIALGSRTLGEGEPKYLNSPDTPLFDKRKTLFALDRARGEIAKRDGAIVVEGYFDAIALHAAGIGNAVASLGTALSQDQLRQLLRYTESKQIALNFDADAAGASATERAIGAIESLVYSGQVQLRVLNLPDGKDADDFLQSHPQASERFRELVAQAPLWIDWQIERLLQREPLDRADGFQRAAQALVQLLNRLTDPNQRSYYLQACAERLSGGDSRLMPLYLEKLQAQLKKPQRRQPAQASGSNATNGADWFARGERNLLAEAEAQLLRIYLHYPQHRPAIAEAIETKELTFSQTPHRFLWQQILTAQAPQSDGDGASGNSLLAELREQSADFPQQWQQLAHLFYLDEKGERDISRASLVVSAAIAAMERSLYEKHKHYCLQRWQQLDPNTQPERWQYYCREFYNAQRQIEALDRQRQFSIAQILDIPASGRS